MHTNTLPVAGPHHSAVRGCQRLFLKNLSAIGRIELPDNAGCRTIRLLMQIFVLCLAGTEIHKRLTYFHNVSLWESTDASEQIQSPYAFLESRVEMSRSMQKLSLFSSGLRSK